MLSRRPFCLDDAGAAPDFPKTPPALIDGPADAWCDTNCEELPPSRCASATGIHTLNVLPCPSPGEAAVSAQPLWSVTMPAAMYRPSPLPPLQAT